MLEFPKKVKGQVIKEQSEQIKILAQALKYVPLAKRPAEHLFHSQVLKSCLFSARIEGNKLTLTEAKKIDLSNPKEKEKKELSNIMQAREQLKKVEKINKKEIKKIHRILMEGMSGAAGGFRKESTAIYDQHGQVVYITPDPETSQEMLDVLIREINQEASSIEQLIFRTAACHYYFEKIHPFIDGNGRTGRLLLHWQLDKHGLTDNKPLPIEEYWEEKRSLYYRHLEKASREIEDFVVFVADSLAWSLEKLLEEIKQLPEQEDNHNLLPRRQEILEIIGDHPHCSMDFIRRRFPTLSKRMIAYDVETLVKKGLVNKHGKTRGVVYSIGK